VISSQDLERCPKKSLRASHYRHDGTCRCTPTDQLPCICRPGQGDDTYVEGCPRHVALSFERGATATRVRAETHTKTYWHAAATVSTPTLVPAAKSNSGVDEVWSSQDYVQCSHDHETKEAADRCAAQLVRAELARRKVTFDE
jgi:hypothetical protein